MLEFSQVENQRTYDDAYGDSGLVVMFLRYDPRYEIYSRQVYSVLPLLGDIGGLQQSLYILGMVVVSSFSNRIFVSSILRHIYQVKNLLVPKNRKIALRKLNNVPSAPNNMNNMNNMYNMEMQLGDSSGRVMSNRPLICNKPLTNKIVQ